MEPWKCQLFPRKSPTLALQLEPAFGWFEKVVKAGRLAEDAVQSAGLASCVLKPTLLVQTNQHCSWQQTNIEQSSRQQTAVVLGSSKERGARKQVGSRGLSETRLLRRWKQPCVATTRFSSFRCRLPAPPAATAAANPLAQ